MVLINIEYERISKEIGSIHENTSISNQQKEILFKDYYENIRTNIENDKGFLIEIFQAHFQKKEIASLSSLIEFIRSEGLFYHRYIKEHGQLLRLILSIGISLLDGDVKLIDINIIFYQTTVYDIIFHQVRLEKFPKICAGLYFELTKKMLDPRLMPLKKEKDNISFWYGQSLHFIERAHWYFIKRKEEFLILWQQIEFQMNNGLEDYWLDEYWPKDYQKLTEEKI